MLLYMIDPGLIKEKCGACMHEPDQIKREVPICLKALFWREKPNTKVLAIAVKLQDQGENNVLVLRCSLVRDECE